MKQLKKVDQKATVKQSNNLTVARYALSLNEQRLMYAICSQIDKNATDFEKVRFSVDDLAKLCNIHGKRKYEDIRKISIKLLKRIVAIPTADGGEYVTHWLQSQRYYPSDTSIEFKIDSDLKGELLQLKKAYVNTPVSLLTSFRKKYSSRMYLILKKMLKVGDFEYRLDFFRDAFQLADTYNKFSNIKNGVIDPSIEELNETSDLYIEHEYVKEGRFFTKIHFNIKIKNKENKKETTEKKALPAPISEEEKLEKETGQGKLMDYPSETTNTKPRGLSDEEQEAYDSLVNRGVAIKKAKELAKKYELKRIKRNLEIAVRQKDTSRNLPGLIISMIEQDTAGQQEIAKQEARARIEARQLDRRQAYDAWHGTDMASIGKARADKGEERKEEAPPAPKELTELEANIIIQAGEKALKPVIEKMKKLGLTIEEVKAGKRK